MKLEMLIAHSYNWFVTERNSRIDPISTVASIFARFESSWLWEILQEKVYKTASLLGAINDATRNDDIAQLGPLRAQSLFQFIQISDAYFVHLLLQ